MRKFDFTLLRYVPDAVKNEFVNIGVMLVEHDAAEYGYADVRFTHDWSRVQCLDPAADVEMLQATERSIREQLQSVADRATFLRKLQESLSNMVQLSASAGCLAEEAMHEMEVLAKTFLESPVLAADEKFKQPSKGRKAILDVMRAELESAGVLGLLKQKLLIETYTRKGDPFRFDFGYEVEKSWRFLQALSMTGADQAVLLAGRIPKLRAGMAVEGLMAPRVLAVVEDQVDLGRPELRYAWATLEDEGVEVRRVSEMSLIAARVGLDLSK